MLYFKNITSHINRYIFFFALVFCACTKVPDYCGDGTGSFDTRNQFCFGNTAFYKCDGREYNPITHECEGGMALPRRTFNTKQFTIFFNTNGGTPAIIPFVTVDSGTVFETIVPENPVKDGYVFGGWFDDALAYDIFAIITQTVMLTASWVKPAYDVTVVSAGTGATGSGSYAEGETVVITAGITPTGQRFTNWTPDNSGVTFDNADNPITAFIMPPYNVTVTANFEGMPTYTVTYNGNGNTGGTAPTDNGFHISGSAVTVLDAGNLEKTGYAFSGWNTAEDASGTNYAPGNMLDITADIILYARWTHVEIPTHTVIVNGGSGGGSYVDGATVNINAGMAPDGARFARWTSENGDVHFADATSAATSFIMPTNDVTVTANFEPIPTYVVTISGTGSGAFGGGSYVEGATVNIYSGTPSIGMLFLNWTSASNGVTFANADNAVTAFTMPSNDVTVTANFELVTYTLTVTDLPIGSGTVSRDPNQNNYTHGSTVIITASALSGYKFDRWNGLGIADVHSASTTVSMTANRYIEAHFVPTITTGSFTDNRDGKTYSTVAMPDGKTWMAENLNYVNNNWSHNDVTSSISVGGGTLGSWCYDNTASNCGTYGRLYTWDAAQTACPVGWRLPTRDDWGSLAIAAGGTGTYGTGDTAGTALKAQSPAWNGTDTHGFSALPGGYRGTDGGFDNVGSNGLWWMATENGSDNAYNRGMGSGDAYVWESWDYKSNGFSVRCVRN